MIEIAEGMASPDPDIDIGDWCGGHCPGCDPYWHEREEICRRFAAEARLSPFTIAERVLAQAGISLRLVRPSRVT